MELTDGRSMIPFSDDESHTELLSRQLISEEVFQHAPPQPILQQDSVCFGVQTPPLIQLDSIRCREFHARDASLVVYRPPLEVLDSGVDFRQGESAGPASRGLNCEVQSPHRTVFTDINRSGFRVLPSNEAKNKLEAICARRCVPVEGVAVGEQLVDFGDGFVVTANAVWAQHSRL